MFPAMPNTAAPSSVVNTTHRKTLDAMLPAKKTWFRRTLPLNLREIASPLQQ
jgi:hypothetical protein